MYDHGRNKKIRTVVPNQIEMEVLTMLAQATAQETSFPSPLTDWLTVSVIARSLHVDNETVRCYIRDGKMKAVKVGRQYRVHPDEYKKFLKV